MGLDDVNFPILGQTKVVTEVMMTQICLSLKVNHFPS